MFTRTTSHEHYLQPYQHNPTLKWKNDAFHFFPRLPLEIRLFIWELALPSERFLRMRLGLPRERDPPQSLSSLVTKESNTVPGDVMKYQIIVEGSRVVPKLLLVNQESRETASKFYRLRIPCRFEADHRRTALGVLYLNPEYDILKIYPGIHQESFIQMLSDLKASDPKSVGLVNLGLDLQDVKCLKNLPQNTLGEATCNGFLSVISSLQNVYFCCLESTGRLPPGLMGFPGSQGKWKVHRSRPILGGVARFQRLLSDPRDIDIDLKEVFVGTSDPRKTIYLWKKMLLHCGVEPHEDMQYHFLVACWSSVGGGQRHIVDRRSAAEEIRTEHEQCLQICRQWRERGVKVPIETHHQPQTAMGFWIFPIDGLGEVPSGDLGESHAERLFQSGRKVDMLQYRPQLALMELP